MVAWRPENDHQRMTLRGQYHSLLMGTKRELTSATVYGPTLRGKQAHLKPSSHTESKCVALRPRLLLAGGKYWYELRGTCSPDEHPLSYRGHETLPVAYAARSQPDRYLEISQDMQEHRRLSRSCKDCSTVARRLERLSDVAKNCFACDQSNRLPANRPEFTQWSWFSSRCLPMTGS